MESRGNEDNVGGRLMDFCNVVAQRPIAGVEAGKREEPEKTIART